MAPEALRVLIVDDDAQVREVLDRVFALRGFETSVARNGREAMALLSANSFDVILLDLNMPGMGGCEVIAEIRGAGVTLPIVVHSAYVGCLDDNRLRELGADEVLLKPTDPPELVRAVKAAAEGGRD